MVMTIVIDVCGLLVSLGGMGSLAWRWRRLPREIALSIGLLLLIFLFLFLNDCLALLDIVLVTDSIEDNLMAIKPLLWGFFYYAYIMISEVKSRQASERRLTVSEENYRSIFENAREGIFRMESGGRITQANPALAAIFGYDSPLSMTEEISFMDEGIYVDVSDRTAFINLLKTRGVVRNFVAGMRHREGKAIWCMITAHSVLNDKGDIESIEGLLTDITELKQVEVALKQSQERLDLALRAVSDGLWDWDMHSDVLYYSPRAYEMLGYEPDEFPPTAENWRNLLHPAGKDRYQEALSSYLQRVEQGELDAIFNEEFRMKSKDGRWKWILIRGRVSSVSDSGELLRMVGTHMDITERKQTEAFLIQSEKMMSVGGLAAGVAHEINNPLAGIIGNAQNLHNRLLSDIDRNKETARECGTTLKVVQDYLHRRGVPKMLQGIMESGKRAAHIVRSMLNYSRKSEKQLSTHSLPDLLDNTVELASNDYQLKKGYDFKKIEILREYAPDAPPLVCEGGEVQQVFFNLIKNGAEAMAEKAYGNGEHPRFIFRVRGENGSVVVEVEDNGPGMDDKTRERVFEPFYTTKPAGKGTGLGLSVSYFIITEQHGGKLEVESSPGDWTRFRISLPIICQGN